ncbi:hypothetical protein [Neopusillimonas maritima]|uniref:Uncharacterized protein n=1 Tax=Neopusillimonas maritima TaxID=2026239 RepID=A0A3A1YUL8_9BURK|nr:hypothetical protein [Neopusillimonas maritima]RIY41953.1 hypothetical protein CJP73_00455 [Neopusillimonas maritima]
MGMNIKGLQATKRALKKEIDKLRTPHYALVGIHQSGGMVKDEPMTVATLGAIQHFGNENIPARRWLDTGAETGTKEYLDTIREGIEEGLDSRQIMARVGVEAEGAIKQYITDLDTPPNNASTVKRKGSSNPLIDTGNMRASVTSTVERKKPKEGME